MNTFGQMAPLLVNLRTRVREALVSLLIELSHFTEGHDGILNLITMEATVIVQFVSSILNQPLN